MQLRTHTRSYWHMSTALDIDDETIELEFAALEGDNVLAEKIGNMLVVAYLVHDDSPSNPMKDFDAQGDLYTDGRDHEIKRQLRLRGGRWSEDQPELDHEFKLDGVTTTLWDLAADEYMGRLRKDQDLLEQWVKFKQREEDLDDELVEGRLYPVDWEELRRDLGDANGVYCDEVEELAINLYSKHWEAMVGPFVIPVGYCHSNHGPGTTSIGVDNWDGDWQNPPNAVWVADKDAEENIVGPGMSDADIRKSAMEYAEDVLNEYAKWCNGEVYGCVVEIFENTTPDGKSETWEQRDSDSCWGFIGYEYAEESLKSEFFDSAVKRLKKDLGLVSAE